MRILGQYFDTILFIHVQVHVYLLVTFTLQEKHKLAIKFGGSYVQE